MKKILYLYNSAVKRNPAKGVNSFNLAAVRALHSLEIEYHGNTFSEDAAGYYEDEDVCLHVVEIYRNPFSKDVLRGYKQLMKLLKEVKFDLIHCNTPIGGFLGRICGHKAGVPKIIYQAHGFHFYKGAPLLNWLLYYPVERWLAHYTDALITINSEDYEIAKRKFKLRNNGKVYYVPGVGIDLNSFKRDNMESKKREELGLKNDDILLISAGRFDLNKNNETTIKAVAKVPGVKLLLCGEGEEENKLKNLALSLGVSDRVLFLGKRTDIKELYQGADIFILSSFREGLSRSIMEAMASGLPCIVSRIRGNVDLIDDFQGGYLFSPYDANELAYKILLLKNSVDSIQSFSRYNLHKIKRFGLDEVINQLKQIYKETIPKD